MLKVNFGSLTKGMRPAACQWLVVLCLVLCPGAARAAYDFVVAQDGSGDFTTVQAAILAVPSDLLTRTTIFIKAGTYREKISVPKTKPNVTLIGEDRDTTILTYDDHATVNPDESVTGTEDTPTFFIKSRAFAAEHITFANTAGDVGPAIAVWVHGTRCHFRDCAFLGYQDTICLYGKLVYFKHCYIEGAIDIVFGPSTAVFQQCAIHCLDSGFLTAAATPDGRQYGFVFLRCTISGDAPAGSVFLGRPWGDDANVVFSHCDMDEEIAPEGWDDWDDEGTQQTAFFAECASTGAGADPADRVDWSHQIAPDDADDYVVSKVFNLPTAPAHSAMLLALPKPWYQYY